MTTRPDPWKGVRPRQLPGLARLIELTPDLFAHYADWPEREAVDMTEQDPAPTPTTPEQDPDPGVQPPGEDTADALRTDTAPEEGAVPEGWVVRWRVTGKDRMTDPWVEQEFPDQGEAAGWAGQRAFLLPREDGVQVRCALVQAQALAQAQEDGVPGA